jgi:hypothetical protein
MKHILAGITEEKFSEIAATLKQRTGMILNGNEGVGEQHGFAMRYFYDATAKTLELELMKKPWYVPQSVIDRKIAEFMHGEGKAFLEPLSPRKREL